MSEAEIPHRHLASTFCLVYGSPFLANLMSLGGPPSDIFVHLSLAEFSNWSPEVRSSSSTLHQCFSRLNVPTDRLGTVAPL